MCILSVYTLLKVVGYYDLSVLSMSVMISPKKSLDGGWGMGGWSELYPIFFGFLEFCLTLRSCSPLLLDGSRVSVPQEGSPLA